MAAMLQAPATAQSNQRAEPRPDFPPSYEVHITPTGAAKPDPTTTEDGNYWVARGWSLQSMISEAWHVDISRLDIADSVDRAKRYDFAMVLPQPEDRETVYRYVREAIPEQLHLHITRESQPKDVFVLTAPNGLSPAVKVLPGVAKDASVSTFTMVSGSSMSISDHSLSGSGVNMEQLCRMMESLLGRPIMDESKVEARFDVEVQSTGHGREALVALLRDKLGLALTPAHRDVEFLVVR